MKTADFDFHLPPGLIALRPTAKRDHSRLLVLHKDGTVEHRHFFDIVHYLKEGDMLLLNDSKVFPARITVLKPTGGKLDVLLVREIDNGTWEILCRGNYDGPVTIVDGISAEVWTETEKGTGERKKRYLKFLNIGPSQVYDMLWRSGDMPLPPYIKRGPDDEDKQRYQTIYADKQGSIAAPTAGLHFTRELIDQLKKNGIHVRTLTLHVGTGTFKPVKASSLSGHIMGEESFEIKSSLPEEIATIKKAGGKLISVGTTATRAIEGFMSGTFRACGQPNGHFRGSTDIFIYPGYKFNVVDSLITNFHLPRSTPFMLVSAFSDLGKIVRTYENAVSSGYRFFSYGDAMLIL